MAIRPEWRRKFYGPAWRRFRARMIQAHGAICMNCGKHTPRYLALAHVSHDPRSSEVRLWCAGCHARNDRRQSFAMRRRNRAKRYGQGWLWAELAWAPFPAWMRPREKEDQGRLF